MKKKRREPEEPQFERWMSPSPSIAHERLGLGDRL